MAPNQIARSKNRGAADGRASAFGPEEHKKGNVVDRAFSRAKQWRGLASRCDEPALA